MEKTMRIQTQFKIITIILVCVIFALNISNAADSGKPIKKFLVRFPTLSLNSGDRIMGVTVEIQKGKIVYVFVPNRWTWQYTGSKKVYCSSPNREYAIFSSAKLPEITIQDEDLSSGNDITINTIIELENSDGYSFTKNINEKELIIKY
jgi:hypothetical protein